MAEGLGSFPDQAKISWYTNSEGLQFLISSIIYDNPSKSKIHENLKQYVLNMFQYFNDLPEVMPLGYFIAMAPVTA